MAETTHNAKGIEIFAVGTWNGDEYTLTDLNAMVEAFSQIGFDPPLKLGHNSEQEEKLMKDGQPALGWIDKLYVQGGKLVADFRDMSSAVFEAIKNKRYRTVSSEIFWNYPDNGRKFSRVLKAVALLGADIPAVTTLKPIEFKWEKDSDLRVVDFANDDFEDEAEKQKRKKEKEKQMSEQILKDKIEELEKKNTTLEESNKTLSGEKETLKTENTTLTESEKAAKTELSKRDEDVRAVQVREFVGKMKTEGRLLPKHEEKVTALLTAASEEKVYKFSKDGKTEELSQREMIESIFITNPDMLQFTEMADGDDPSADEKHDYTTQKEAGNEVDRRTKVFMAKQGKEGKIATYTDAMQVVLNDDSKLKKVYTGG